MRSSTNQEVQIRLTLSGKENQRKELKKRKRNPGLRSAYGSQCRQKLNNVLKSFFKICANYGVPNNNNYKHVYIYIFENSLRTCEEHGSLLHLEFKLNQLFSTRL